MLYNWPVLHSWPWFPGCLHISGLSKAFEKVQHSLLTSKLVGFHIYSSALKWITSFLANRSEFVFCNDTGSYFIAVESSASQGPVLGHLLFSYILTTYTPTFHLKLNFFTMTGLFFVKVLTILILISYTQNWTQIVTGVTRCQWNYALANEKVCMLFAAQLHVLHTTASIEAIQRFPQKLKTAIH